MGVLFDEDLYAVEGVIHNYDPRKLATDYFYRGDFNRDWNLQRLRQAPRQVNAFQVAGRSMEAELWQWGEPVRVVLARFAVDQLPVLAVSLGLTSAELIEVLSTLVLLREDEDAMILHQRQYDDSSCLLRQRHRRH